MCYVQQPMLLSFNSKLQLHTFDLLFVDYRLSPKQFPCDSKGKKGQFQLLGKGIPFFLRVIFDVRILGRPLKFDYFKEILVCVMCITHGIIINQIGQPIAIFLSNMKRTEESNIHHFTLSVLSCFCPHCTISAQVRIWLCWSKHSLTTWFPSWKTVGYG